MDNFNDSELLRTILGPSAYSGKAYVYELRNFDYNPPDEFKHGEESLVAEYEAENEDGQDVKIYETRYPAAFWRVRVEPASHYVPGLEPHSPGISIRTGSGIEVGRLVFQIAEAISEGMLGFSELREPQEVQDDSDSDSDI